VLTHLARHHEVTLVSFVRPGEARLVSELQELGMRTVALPFNDRNARGVARLDLLSARARAAGRCLGTRYPFYVEKYWSKEHSRNILALTAEQRPDAIQIEYLQLSLYVRDLRRWRESRPTNGGITTRPRLVLNTHDLGSVPRWRRAALAPRRWQKLRWESEARAWERLQVDATTWADTSLCVTDQDLELLRDLGGHNCRTVPLGIDTEIIQPVWQPIPPTRLLFVGSFNHGPNRSAALFLIENVWPEVAKSSESARLLLAGRGSRDFLGSLASPPAGIQALGFVSDLTSLYRECELFVAPLTEGGGIKIKILEAMAHGIPVVTTPIGAEGIVAPTENAIWFAEPDVTFAPTTIRALQDADESRHRALRAREIIEQRFSWSAITKLLTSIYEGR
jgi:glycosyltransferase involved in cell wall biosynthesis